RWLPVVDLERDRLRRGSALRIGGADGERARSGRLRVDGGAERYVTLAGDDERDGRVAAVEGGDAYVGRVDEVRARAVDLDDRRLRRRDHVGQRAAPVGSEVLACVR